MNNNAFYNIKLSLKKYWNPQKFNYSYLKYFYMMKSHRYMLLFVHIIKLTIP